MRATDPEPSVKVIRDGFIVQEGNRIADAASSVALIGATSQRIVVDTGSPRDIELLANLFRDECVVPESINIVVNTHLHVDHAGCNELFRNARFVAHELEEPPVGTLRIRETTELAPGVMVVPTPGHTRGSISVFVSGEKKVAICGDAIPTSNNYQKHVPPFVNVDRRLALESMDVILDWADEVVPGHDHPFEVLGKKYHA